MLVQNVSKGRQDNLTQPGDYVVEITDRGMELTPRNDVEFYVEFVPLKLVFDASEGVVYKHKRHVCLNASRITNPTRTHRYADAMLRRLIVIEKQLIGQQHAFRCWHEEHDGHMEERWQLLVTDECPPVCDRMDR